MVYGELDLLPEEIDWRDEGCEVSGSCLNCPLPRCVEDEPRGQQRQRLAARNKRMVELRRSGRSITDIAGLFGVSRRTVERALRAKSACHSEGAGDRRISLHLSSATFEILRCAQNDREDMAVSRPPCHCEERERCGNLGGGGNVGTCL